MQNNQTFLKTLEEGQIILDKKFSKANKYINLMENLIYSGIEEISGLNKVNEIKKMPEMKGISLFEMNNQGKGIVSSISELLNSGMIGGLFSVLIF